MVILIAGLLGIFLRETPDRSATTASAADLVKQMEAAARSDAPDRNVYGGRLRVARGGQAITVIAENVPPKACVLAGWELARKGVLSVNGATPFRVSAANLADLCNDGDVATLSWVARPDGK